MPHSLRFSLALTLMMTVPCLAAGGVIAPAALRVADRAALLSSLTLPPLTGLDTTVTRELQMQALLKDPVQGAKLKRLHLHATKPTPADPWTTGVTLTPCSPLYPKGSSSLTMQLGLTTYVGVINPSSPSPSATGPLLLIDVDTAQAQILSDRPLLQIDVHFPASGPYMLTFVMSNAWPYSTARPQLSSPGTAPEPLVPNKTPGATQWTILWDAGQKVTDVLYLKPGPQSNPGGAFFAALFTKLVVTKL
ncbi:MAG: hypothetical protein WCP21_15605 [Armatimonadota bacterium]